jgi:FtsP/CotA-like multicopper oxidase with cupredoxin domain
VPLISTHVRRRRGVLLAALIALVAAGGLQPASAHGAVREYWIAAVNTPWDVAPNGGDPVMGTLIPPAQRRFIAVVYRRYTPGFRRPWPNTAISGDNDGIPGPTIRAEVGDTVIVHFRNRDHHYRLHHSMHFHAFKYAPSSDGAYIPFISGPGGNVPVGGHWTYRLRAVADSYGVWPYHDHSSSMTQSMGLGLYGAISIRKPGEPLPDREFVVYLQNHLGFDTVNGRAFIGNTPTFHAKVGDHVQWDVLGLGDAFHVFHVHGHRWLRNGTPTDSELVGPSSTLKVNWVEDAPGTWYWHCHVESHQDNGMIGLYKVDR